MKKVFLLSPVFMLSLAVNAQKKGAAKKPAKANEASMSLKTETDSISYAFGISLGQYLKSQSITSVNYKMLNSAIDAILQDKKGLMDATQAGQFMSRVAETKMKKAAGAEKQKCEQFLEVNKKRAGVMTTASGLQYEIIRKGEGPMPKASDTVVAHYAGSLIDGKEFDNSYKRNEPLTIPVSGVIRGWTEALQLMPVGSKWKLYIPSSLGYGDAGAGQDIPGGAALIFEVELLEIKGAK